MHSSLSLDCVAGRGKRAALVGSGQRLSRGIHLRQKCVPPCYPLREDLLNRTGIVVTGVCAQRITAFLDRLDRLQEQTTRHDDGAVGRPQMLSGAIYYRPHALLHPPVLGVDTINTREGLSLLDLAIDKPIVPFVAEGAERGLVHVIRAIAATTLQTVFFGQGLIPEAIHPVPDHAILVIHRYPEVPRGPRTHSLAL